MGYIFGKHSRVHHDTGIATNMGYTVDYSSANPYLASDIHSMHLCSSAATAERALEVELPAENLPLISK